MATVEEENTVTIYDEIGIHTDTQPHEEVNYNIEYDIKEENTNDPTDHTKKHSSLLDLDFTPQKTNCKPLSEQDRKSSVQSTESVEVYIYRRSSIFTSSGGSVMKMDDNETNNGHQQADTGTNVYMDTNNNNKIPSYQPYTNTNINDVIFADKYDNNNDVINYSPDMSDIQPTNIETTENEEISIIHNKSRHSLSVDEQYENKNNNNINTTIITRKSSTVSGPTSVVYHGSDSENINMTEIEPTMPESLPVRSSSIIYYSEEEIPKNGLIQSQINESRNSIQKNKLKMDNSNYISGNLTIYSTNEIVNKTPKQKQKHKHINKSSILEMIGPINENINRIKPNGSLQLSENELDEQFYKQRFSISKLNNENNLLKHKHRYKSQSEMNHKYVNEMDIKEDTMPQELTSDNLTKLNYENRLNEINDIHNINLTNSHGNKKERYISMTGNKYNGQYNKYERKDEYMKIYLEPVNEKGNKLSTKVKYITAIGAVCAVTVLIGFVLYSKSSNRNRNVTVSRVGNTLMAPRHARRSGPPRTM